MKLTKVQLGILALIATNVIWGAAFPIYKWALQDVPPFTFLFFRFFLAAWLILPFTGPTLRIKQQDWGTLTALSLSGTTLAVAFWFLGLKMSASINAPIIAATGPIFILLFAVLFLKEKLKLKTVIGTAISMGGVLFIVIRPLFEHGGSGSLEGNIFFLLATLAGVAHVILLKRLSPKYNILAITFWSFIIGSLAAVPLTVYESTTIGLLPNLHFQGIVGLIFGTIFSSALAYSLYIFGIKQVSVNETGVFSYIEPIIASLVALPLLGEQINTAYVFGAFMVFLGIYISEAKLHYHPFHR